jgi:ABC-type sugar transport system substrate-binding protein
MGKISLTLLLGILLGGIATWGFVGTSHLDMTIAKPNTAGTRSEIGPRWTLTSKQVAYVLPNDGPYYDLKWYGVSTELEKLGYQPQKYSAGGYKGLKNQVDIMDDLIQKGVGAIILHAVDEKALVPSVERAADVGIPVIAENVNIYSPKLAGSVQLANYQNGWELAMALVQAIGGKGKIVSLIGPPGLDVTDEMWRGAKGYLERFPGVQVVREEYLQVNVPDAEKITGAILLAHPDIDGIYAWYVQNAIGAALAVKNKGIKPGQVKIVAKDTNPQGESLLKEGYLSWLLVGEPIEMGRVSARMVDSVFKGAAYEKRVLMRNRLVGPITIDLIDRSGFDARGNDARPKKSGPKGKT